MIIGDLAHNALSKVGVGTRHDQSVAIGARVLFELDTMLGRELISIDLPANRDLGRGLDERFEAGLCVLEHFLACWLLNELGQKVFFFSYFLFGLFV